MTDPTTFTFTQLLAFGTFLLALIVGMVGIVIKLISLSASLKRIKNNDLEEFIKREEFEGLEKEVSEIGKTVVRLDERSEKQEKSIDALFKWKNSQ